LDVGTLAPTVDEPRCLFVQVPQVWQAKLGPLQHLIEFWWPSLYDIEPACHP
jgi:hypothetical protein